MSSTAHAIRTLSPEEYLAVENDGQERHEYVDGVIYAMGGASDRHGLVAMAIGSRLFSHVAEPCQVFMVDMKVRIKQKRSTKFYYPDVVVSCAEDDRASHFREKPVLIVEVLSPSTDRIDRFEKFDSYTSMPTLIEYVLANQDVPRVDVFRRSTAWQGESYLLGSSFTLESVGLAMAVDEIYRRVKF